MSGDMTIPQCIFAGLFFVPAMPLLIMVFHIIMIYLLCSLYEDLTEALNLVFLVCSNSCSSMSAFRVQFLQSHLNPS